MMLVLVGSFCLFFSSAFRTFTADKKHFVMELNLTALDAATSRTTLELSRRISELQFFVPWIYKKSQAEFVGSQFPAGIDKLATELIGISFYEMGADGHVINSKTFTNPRALLPRGFGPEKYGALSSKNSDLLQKFPMQKDIGFWNRSLAGDHPLPILTIGMKADSNQKGKEIFVVADLLQDFLVQALQRSDVASAFLVSANGELISHSSFDETIAQANKPFGHPVLGLAMGKRIPKESQELTIQGEKYLCSFANTAFSNLTIVTQISEAQAFYAIKKIGREWFGIALLVFYAAFAASLFLSRRLTKNIQQLGNSAAEVGKGNFDLQLNIKSGDEVEDVGNAFETMAKKVKQLLLDSVEKARMEQELKTASVLQSTLLEPLNIQLPELEIISFFRPATECGGDFWHVVQEGSTLTLAIGDSTGHGAAAAIVTSLMKSVFSTLKITGAGDQISPEQCMAYLNESLYESAKGKLLMTLNLCRIDLKTGKLTLLNGGHEAPLLVGTQKKGETTCEPLFSRGERLGFSAESKFSAIHHQFATGDTLLFYTDGLTETNGEGGKAWGERVLKKMLLQCNGKPLSEARDFLTQSFLRHVGKSVIPDDVSYILLRWKKAESVRKAA